MSQWTGEHSAIHRATRYGIKLMTLQRFVRVNAKQLLSMSGDYDHKLRELGFKKTTQEIELPQFETPSGWSLRAVADFESADLDGITEIVYQWTPATKKRNAVIEAFYKQKEEI